MDRQDDPTDPTGHVFIAYRRARGDEAGRLARALSVHGVPSWLDVADLGPGPTEEHVREVLGRPSTAAALVWITPDLADSAFIRGIEVPLLAERAGRRDGFFALTVAAGGLDPATAGALASARLHAADLRHWNTLRVDSDPLDAADAAMVARRLLACRLDAIHERLEPGRPLLLRLYTWRPPPLETGVALWLDWSSAFATRRFSDKGAWEAELEPALDHVQRAIATRCPGRPVVAEMQASLSVAAAAGYCFRQPAGIAVTWNHRYDDLRQEWSLTVPEEESGVQVEPVPLSPSASDVAVLVSATQPVGPAFTATRASLPPLRGIIEVTWPGLTSGATMTPGQGIQVAERLRLALVRARAEWGMRALHLFYAGPAPLAALIGQLLNTFAPVTVYEHVEADGGYAPALTLSPPPAPAR